MSPHTEGETGTRQWKEGGEGGGALEDVLPCKRMLTVNAIAVNAANTSQSRSTWNPGACTYQKHR